VTGQQEEFPYGNTNKMTEEFPKILSDGSIFPNRPARAATNMARFDMKRLQKSNLKRHVALIESYGTKLKQLPDD